MPTSISSTVSAGSYWRAKINNILVKVIVPHAVSWGWLDEPVVVFRTHSNKDGDPVPIVQHFMTIHDFLEDFEPAEWDKETQIWA